MSSEDNVVFFVKNIILEILIQKRRKPLFVILKKSTTDRENFQSFLTQTAEMEGIITFEQGAKPVVSVIFIAIEKSNSLAFYRIRILCCV